MNLLSFRLPLFLILCSCLLNPPLRAAEDEINVDRTRSGVRLVPIALEGFSGEVAGALKFDLEIQGFQIIPADKAQYVASGTQGASLTGYLQDRISKAWLLSQEYTGGAARLQAHAFADDIVLKLTGQPGVARTRIAFKAETPGNNSEIYLSDYDGYNAQAVTRDNTISRDPAWLPGGRVLYYTSYKSGNPWIYSHELQSGIIRKVAGFTGLNTGAALSPDGRRIAVILSKAGSPDLYVGNADGSNLTRLTFTKEDESSPCWSPDGQTICFVSRARGVAELYRIPAAGGSMDMVRTGIPGNLTEPDWSPDGKMIVFTAQSGGFVLGTVPTAGGVGTLLKKPGSEEAIHGEDPSWGPNSRTVIFTRRVGDRRFLSLLDVITKQVKDVRQISGSCSQPAWAK
jgi:TolB protein